MADFVTLSCPSCAGRLEITQDIERFACAHCGREHIVKRSGSIVSLSPVVDALRKVEVGVDKTAAELAIVRLRREIEDIQAQKSTLFANSPRPQGGLVPVLLISCGAVLAVLGLITIATTQPPSARLAPSVYTNDSLSLSKWCIVGGIIMGLMGLIQLSQLPSNTKRWEETVGVRLKSLDEQLAAKHTELLHHRNVVSP